MKLRKIIALLLIAFSALSLLVGCSGKSNGDENQSTKGKEPALVSANKTTAWPGADLEITFSYDEEIGKEQIKVTVGGLEAKVESCINNQVRIQVPNGIKSGTHSITAKLDDKACEGSASVQVTAPVIKIIDTY